MAEKIEEKLKTKTKRNTKKAWHRHEEEHWNYRAAIK